MNEAKRRANMKYKREKVKQVSLQFYPTESDLLEHLDRQPKKQTYIKALIRADMENKKGGEG